MLATRNKILFSTALLPLTACGALVEPDTPDASPTISITSPAKDERVRRIVAVSASAVAAGGSVTSVQFRLPDGNSVTDREPPFSTIWDSTTVPDGAHMIRVTATDDQGATGAAETTLLVANKQCVPGRLTAQDLPGVIPDGNVSGIRSAIGAFGDGRVVALSLSLRITHPSASDIGITLISPSGSGFSIEGRDAEERDDVITLDNQIVTDFDGQTAEGTWTLVIQDNEKEDTGTLDSWSLAIATDCAARTP